jgi:hypothetical protein
MFTRVGGSVPMGLRVGLCIGACVAPASATVVLSIEHPDVVRRDRPFDITIAISGVNDPGDPFAVPPRPLVWPLRSWVVRLNSTIGAVYPVDPYHSAGYVEGDMGGVGPVGLLDLLAYNPGVYIQLGQATYCDAPLGCLGQAGAFDLVTIHFVAPSASGLFDHVDFSLSDVVLRDIYNDPISFVLDAPTHRIGITPEPGSIALSGLGLIALALARRRGGEPRSGAAP